MTPPPEVTPVQTVIRQLTQPPSERTPCQSPGRIVAAARATRKRPTAVIAARAAAGPGSHRWSRSGPPRLGGLQCPGFRPAGETAAPDAATSRPTDNFQHD